MKDHQPLISIIIPVHNTQDFLNDCLESVISQTYQNLETIIINDDSTDGSESIIDEFKDKDKRVKYFYTKKRNAALARREGIKRAAGSYVCFVDSDDVVHEKYVETLYDTLRKTGAKIATAKIATFSGSSGIKSTYDDTHKLTTESNLLAYFGNNYFGHKESRHIAQSINAKIFSRDLLEDIDYSVLKTSILEDNYIIPQILKKVKPQKITLVDSTLYYYRINPHSTMAQSLSKMIDYHGEKISYPQLFEETMSYIQELYTGYKNVDTYIYKIKAQRYYELAKLVVENNMRIVTLTESNERLAKASEEYKMRANDILNSRTYKIGRILTGPARVVKRIVKG